MKKILIIIIILGTAAGAFWFAKRPAPLEKGRKYLDAGETDRAIGVFRAALDKKSPPSPVEESMRSELARAYLLKGAVDNAREEFGRLVEKFPGNAYAHLGLGFVHMARGFDQFAVESFEKARQCDPDDLRSSLALAGLYNYRNEFDKAAEEYKKVLGSHSTERAALIGLGSVYRQQGLFQEAIGLYERALASFPRDFPTRLALARAYRESRQAEKAEEELRAVLSQHPDDPSALMALGDLRQSQERTEEARDYYAGVYNKERQSVYAGCRLALCAARLGDLEGAKFLMNKLEQVVPKAEGTGLATFASLAEVETMLDHFHHVRRARMEYALSRAKLYMLEKLFPEADKEIRNALLQNSMDLNSLRLMVELSALRGSAEDQLKWARRASEAFPKHPEVQNDLKIALAKAPKEAEKPARREKFRSYR